MPTDVVEIGDLNCALCGNSNLEASCPEHGPQDNANLRRLILRCMEYDYETGKECWCRLDVVCGDCGSDAVEGLDDSE